MSDIELVIKIPEEMYKKIQIRDWRKDDAKWFSEEWKAIRDGTPLPKEHGVLKDADALFDKIRTEIEQSVYPIVSRYNHIEKGMTLDEILHIINKYNNMEPTIIEADKESD